MSAHDDSLYLIGGAGAFVDLGDSRSEPTDAQLIEGELGLG